MFVNGLNEYEYVYEYEYELITKLKSLGFKDVINFVRLLAKDNQIEHGWTIVYTFPKLKDHFHNHQLKTIALQSWGLNMLYFFNSFIEHFPSNITKSKLIYFANMGDLSSLLSLFLDGSSAEVKKFITLNFENLSKVTKLENIINLAQSNDLESLQILLKANSVFNSFSMWQRAREGNRSDCSVEYNLGQYGLTWSP